MYGVQCCTNPIHIYTCNEWYTAQIKLTFFEHSSQHLSPQPHFVTREQMQHHLVPVSDQQ